jgi:hypothetical protein
MTFIRARPSADRQDRLLRALGNRQPAVHLQTASVTQRRVGDAAATAASAGRPSANRVCNGNAMDVRVSSVCEVHFTGALHPPALALQCERLPAKQRFLRCTNVHSTKSGGRQPAVVLESRWCTQCDFRRGTHAMRKSGVSQPAVGGRIRIGRHERHSSADRQRCVRIVVAIAFKATTGGLRPPALASQCERLPAKRRFLRCTNVHSPRSGGRQPAVLLESRWCTQCDFRRGTHAVHKSGVSQPPWCASHLRHRKLPSRNE